MTLNADLIRDRCQEITQSIARLEGISKVPEAEFLASDDAKDIASYRLLVAIEAALAICYHVCSKKLQTVPEEYAQCFTTLSENKLISEELSIELQKMARFRNLLVHMYYKVDYTRVYEIVNNRLSDLKEFCASMVKLL
jgi:uncharacterized protein YutE (UPF0331/DUF86 family)